MAEESSEEEVEFGGQANSAYKSGQQLSGVTTGQKRAIQMSTFPANPQSFGGGGGAAAPANGGLGAPGRAVNSMGLQQPVQNRPQGFRQDAGIGAGGIPDTGPAPGLNRMTSAARAQQAVNRVGDNPGARRQLSHIANDWRDFGEKVAKHNLVLLFVSFIFVIFFLFAAGSVMVAFSSMKESDCTSMSLNGSIRDTIVDEEITLLSQTTFNSDAFVLLFNSGDGSTGYTEYNSWSEMSGLEALSNLYLLRSQSTTNSMIVDCLTSVTSASTLNGYLVLNNNDYLETSDMTVGFIVTFILHSIFFIFFEYAYFVYSEVMLPQNDALAFGVWSFTRLSFFFLMFSSVSPYAFLYSDSVNKLPFLVGVVDTQWISYCGYLSIAYWALGLFCCCCCLCLNEGSDGGNLLSNDDDNTDGDSCLEKMFCPMARRDTSGSSEAEVFLLICVTFAFVIGIGFTIFGLISFASFFANIGHAQNAWIGYLFLIWFILFIIQIIVFYWKLTNKDDANAATVVRQVTVAR